MSKSRIAIICGGPSSEHEVSCVSGGGVLAGLDLAKFEAILIGITKSGQWILLPNDYPLTIIDGQMPTIAENESMVELTAQGFVINGTATKVDCVFSVLHGEFGEDGKIQQLLADAGLTYVGSGVRASAQAMDKAFAKRQFTAAGMQVATGFVVSAADWQQKSGEITYPVFVKPASGGSSRGTHKVRVESALAAAVADALLYDDTVLIETAIVGLEIECAVLEHAGQIQASVVGEIVIDPKFEFYDFAAKYLDDSTVVKIPANLSESAAAEIQSQAITAFKSLGCSGLARCDFFYTNDGEIIINEINTMPGFTGTSVYPKLWQASGIGYTELITVLIETAIAN